jgi:hypothetical protein
LEKVFVQVDSEKRENGDVIPKTITWVDGRAWNIDRVIHSCASLDGEYEGIRYTIYIGSAERYLYKAGHAWYVMA